MDKAGRLYLRLTVADKELCLRAAKSAGMRLSDWIRSVLLEAADRVLSKRQAAREVTFLVEDDKAMPSYRTTTPSQRPYNPRWCARCNRIGSASCPKCKGKS